MKTATLTGRQMGHRTEFGKESYHTILKRLKSNIKSRDRGDDLQKIVSRSYDKMIASLVSKGVRYEFALDTVQEFILRKLLDPEFLEKVDLNRGQFDSFLLTCLYRFFIDQVRKEKREEESLQRFASENLEESDCQVNIAEQNISRRWAIEIFGKTIRALKNELVSSGNEIQWKMFALKFIRPMKDGQRNRVIIPMAKLTTQLGLKSVKRLEYLLKKTRERFLKILKQQIHESGYSASTEAEEHLLRLKTILTEPEAWLQNWKEVLPEECHWCEEDLPTECWSWGPDDRPKEIDVSELFGGGVPFPVVTEKETACIWEATHNQPYQQFITDYLSELNSNLPLISLQDYMLSDQISLEHLDLVRKAAKSGMQSGDFPYMAPIFHMLYVLAIARALNLYQIRISRMTDKDVINTLQYAQQQSWIPGLIQRDIELAIRHLLLSRS